MADHTKILAFIGKCEEPEALRQIIFNAKGGGDQPVANAAFKKLISIVPGEEPGTIEYDLWQTILAFEQMLTQERGKTVRLARTRQKLARVGVLATLKDWAEGKPTDGFNMLIERGMPELTGEAIVVKYASMFPLQTVAAARDRLEQVNVRAGASRSPV